MLNTCTNPKVTEIEIPVENLPMDKLTIVQLADIHIDITTKYETIKKIEKCGVTTYKIPKEVLRLRKTITLFRWKLYKEINII